MSQRIVLFGGAFDPPHNGHVAMAQAATDEIQPDKLLWIPTARPAHRQPAVATFQQRCDMIQLITDTQSCWEVCPIEAEREGISYFVDTLNAIEKDCPDAQFYLLLGADQLNQLTQWHQWRTIHSKVTLVVMPRTGSDPSEAIKELNAIQLHAKPVAISSSDIRSKNQLTEIPSAVAHYLLQHKLRY